MARELGFSGNLQEVVAASCVALAVPAEGQALQERAERCYELIWGSPRRT